MSGHTANSRFKVGLSVSWVPERAVGLAAVEAACKTKGGPVKSRRSRVKLVRSTNACKTLSGCVPASNSTLLCLQAIPFDMAQKNGVPKDLERLWMGHAPEKIEDIYSKLKEDVGANGPSELARLCNWW